MSLLVPDFYYTSVHAVDFDELSACGVRGLLLDLDNTLLPRDTNVVPDELKRWAAELAERDIAACLVSNNWHSYVLRVAEDLGFKVVHRAIKPLPFAFRRGLDILGLRASETAVIGDQLFTDVLGGNLAGLTTVLVLPLSRHDLPHTLLLRLIEARILADREPLA